MSKKRTSPTKSTFFADFGVPNALPAAPVQAVKLPAKVDRKEPEPPIASQEISSGEDPSAAASQ